MQFRLSLIDKVIYIYMPLNLLYDIYVWQNYHLQASMRLDIWNAFVHNIMVGNIYEISEFNVRYAFGQYWAVRSPMCIIFTNKTTVHMVVDDDLSIPSQKFDLLQLTHIFENAEDYHKDRTYAIGDWTHIICLCLLLVQSSVPI